MSRDPEAVRYQHANAIHHATILLDGLKQAKDLTEVKSAIYGFITMLDDVIRGGVLNAPDLCRMLAEYTDRREELCRVVAEYVDSRDTTEPVKPTTPAVEPATENYWDTPQYKQAMLGAIELTQSNERKYAAKAAAQADEAAAAKTAMDAQFKQATLGAIEAILEQKRSKGKQ